MNSQIDNIAVQKGHRAKGVSLNHRIAKKMVLSVFEHLALGHLIVTDGVERLTYGQAPEETDLVAEVNVHDELIYSEIAYGGAIGSGESYMEGHWSSPDLAKVTQLFVRNLPVLDAMDAKQSWLSRALLKTYHWFNRNTVDGSRKNISAHYDLGNDFFKLFLDRNMMYSSAMYPTPEADIDVAGEHKLKLCCDKLQLQPSDHLLEIGTGWGGLACYAAKHYGCQVTTTTISKEQFAQAQQRVKEQGLEDKVTLLLEDYRDLTGEYDKLISIEMIEAVGHEHFRQYFSKCSSLLKGDGLMLIQAITIADQRYQKAKQEVDFIQRYIFPGGCLPSIEVIGQQVSQATDMVIIGLEEIGHHYAETLADWRNRFFAQIHQVKALGFDQRFIRMWDYYLCYCEGGFRERSIGTSQVVMAKPEFRHDHVRSSS